MRCVLNLDGRQRHGVKLTVGRVMVRIQKKYFNAMLLTAFIVIAFSAAVFLAEIAPVDSLPVDEVSLSQAQPNTETDYAHEPYGREKERHKMSKVSRAERDESVGRRAELGSDDITPLSKNAPVFDAEAIFEATQKVRVDDQGAVVIDHDAMVVLQQVLGQRELQLDELALAELKDLIQYALPDPAGAQVAVIAGNYYAFLQAKREYEELNKSHDENSGYELHDNYDAQHYALQVLREAYLGPEVAEKLFAQADAENKYMRDNFVLAENKNLTQKERQQQAEALKTEHLQRLLKINGWQSRYQQFSQEKQSLLESSAEESAVTELWRAHFTDAEREKMAALQIPF